MVDSEIAKKISVQLVVCCFVLFFLHGCRIAGGGDTTSSSYFPACDSYANENVYCIDDEDTQGDIAAIQNLQVLDKSLIIKDTELSNLSFLSGITEIQGSLDILNNANLTTIGGGAENRQTTKLQELNITGNHNLKNLYGLNHLDVTQGDIVIIQNQQLEALSDSKFGSGVIKILLSHNPALTDVSSLQSLINADIIALLLNSLMDLSGLANLENVLQLKINDNTLNSLAGMDSLQFVEELNIQAPMLADFVGLNDVVVINKFILQFSDSITSLDGLFANQSHVEQIILQLNDGLSDISALANLTTINSLGIGGLPLLQDLRGMESFSSIGRLGLSNNDSLVDLTALANLTVIHDGLAIRENKGLTDLQGLEQITSIGEGGLIIWKNPSLTDISAFANLTSLSGSLSVSLNSILVSLNGLQGLSSIDGGLDIWKNEALTDLSALSNVTSVGSYVSVKENNTLPGLNGLGQLQTIGGSLLIQYNALLASTAGLANLTSVKSLTIQRNPVIQELGMGALSRIEEMFVFESNLLLCETGPDSIDTLFQQLLGREGIGAPGNTTEGIRIVGNRNCI